MCAASTTRYDVANTALFVCHVLDIYGVTVFAMSPTEVGVSSAIWPLHSDDEAINEEHHLILA